MADSVASKFQGLPMEDLIAAPLKAACDSQMLLAQSAFEFMTRIGYIGDPNKQQTRLISFDLERPVEGSDETSLITVNAPFLGLVPIPALLIEDVQIDFQMEVTDATTEKSTSSKEASMEASVNVNYLFVKASAKLSGKVSSSRENTRSTNQTAKYQVHVSARQQRPTEGMSKLMDLMASTVEPLPRAK